MPKTHLNLDGHFLFSTKVLFQNHLNGDPDKYSGLITSKRTTSAGIEASAIDFVILSHDMISDYVSLQVDEEKKFSLTSITRTKNLTVTKESDHNTLVCSFSFTFNPHIKKHKTEVFNFKDKRGQEKFKSLTTGNKRLSSIFEEEGDLNVATKKFVKTLNRLFHQSFRKIRIRDIQNKDIAELFNKRRILRTKEDVISKQELKNVEEELALKCAKENFIKITKEFKDIKCDEGGYNAGKFWMLKKKLCPRAMDPPTAMIDENGKLTTSAQGVTQLSVKHYSKILENRPMLEKYSKLQKDKEDLCEERVNTAKQNKTPMWDKEDLDTVLKYLKKNKSRDPNGFANEIFKPEVAGEDLKIALLVMMNKIKQEQVFPTLLEHCTISSIFKKGKKGKNDLNNYRGIFRVNIFRSILDRLIFNDYYGKIDDYLSDCNVGGRRGRNIRDNLFVFNAITNNVTKGK